MHSTCYDVDFMRTCCDCAVVVWIGDEQECPKDVQLSYPKDADWTDVAEPYCKACWEIESAVLHKMSAEHKAIGPKEKPAAKPKPAAAKNQTAADETKHVTNKRSLGGVQHVLKKPLLPSFSVGQSVNAKFSNGHYYGAFISKVHDDKTYDLYFFEEEDADKAVLHKVPAKNVKEPLQTNWSKRYDNWEAYIGKIFYDPGTKDDPDLPDYEAGEFKVSSVTKENNFTCKRLGSDIYDDFDIGYVIKRIRLYEEE